MQIAIYGEDSEQVNTSFGRTKSYFKTLSFGLEEDNYVVLPALLSMLPLGYDSTIQEFYKHYDSFIVELFKIADSIDIEKLSMICAEEAINKMNLYKSMVEQLKTKIK